MDAVVTLVLAAYGQCAFGAGGHRRSITAELETQRGPASSSAAPRRASALAMPTMESSMRSRRHDGGPAPLLAIGALSTPRPGGVGRCGGTRTMIDSAVARAASPNSAHQGSLAPRRRDGPRLASSIGGVGRSTSSRVQTADRGQRRWRAVLGALAVRPHRHTAGRRFVISLAAYVLARRLPFALATPGAHDRTGRRLAAARAAVLAASR